MWELVRTVARSVVSAAKGRRNLVFENLALRHQLAVLRRQSKKPKLKDTDRLFLPGTPEALAGMEVVALSCATKGSGEVAS